jgi:hypothetical protein
VTPMFKKIALACRVVVRHIDAGRIKMKDLRRGKVFFDNGACGCAFGRVLDLAGARSALVPYHRRTTGGGKEARWTDNCTAFTAATGRPTRDFDHSDPVAAALMEVELANDAATGASRKPMLRAALLGLASTLEAA